MNLRSVDLNLLVVFRALMTTRSVARSAERLGLSPSAVSHALRRLRAMFDDELFRRGGGGLEPTPRARELWEEIERGLAHIEAALAAGRRFDPARARRRFSIQVADYVSAFLLPRLAEHLGAEAPGVAIEVLPFARDRDEAPEADLQIRFTLGEGRPDDRARRLLTDSFRVVMRAGHPAAEEPMTPERYAALGHVKVALESVGTSIIDEALARRGLRRTVAMTVRSWFELPAIIERTDFVAIVPNRWPAADDRLARLASAPLPLDEVRFAIDLCWSLRRERDPGHGWLRTLVADIFASAGGGEDAAGAT